MLKFPGLPGRQGCDKDLDLLRFGEKSYNSSTEPIESSVRKEMLSILSVTH